MMAFNGLNKFTVVTWSSWFLLATWSGVTCAPVSNEIPCQNTVWPQSAQRVTEYTYSASVSHFLSGTVPRSTTRINCDVKLWTVSAGCKHVLQVHNCAVKSEGVNRKQSNGNGFEISGHEVVFELDEDHNIQEIVADVNDTATSVNVKRGILSLLQHSLHRHREGEISQKSVHGQCDTQYSKESERHVVMTADLNSCVHSSIHKLLPLVQLPDKSRIQEVIPVTSKKDCSVHLNARHQLDDISCKETHLDTVAHKHAKHRLVVLQQLKLDTFVRPSPTPVLDTSSYIPIDILYQHEHYTPVQYSVPTPDPPTATELKTGLTELHQVYETKGTKPLVTFKALASKVKAASEQTLEDVQNALVKCTLSSCTHETKRSLLSLWFDALLYCGTDPCLHSAVHLVTSAHMPHSHRRQLWYGLTLTTDLKEDMVTSLIEKCQKHLRNDCILSLSVILNNEDTNLSAVMTFLGLLKQQLNKACSTSEASSHTSRHVSVKSVLKAVHNLAHKVGPYDRVYQAGESVTSALHKCLQNSKDTDILQIVIKNLVRLQSWTQSKSEIVEMFQDSKRSIEVRVAALKSILQSDDVTGASLVLETYQDETNKQFKAYLTSYLSSILQDETKPTESVPKSLRQTMMTMNLSFPLTYSHSQASRYSVLRSELSGGEKSSIEADTLHYPGSLLPNALNVQFNIQAYGLKYSLADIVLQNQGFDFTSEIYGEEEQMGKYRHLSAMLSRALQSLQEQVTSTYTLPFIEADYGIIGQLLGSTKVQDFSLWSAFAHSQDFHGIWDILNLDYIVSKLQNGLHLNWSKYSQMSLLQVSLPTGMGLPLTYTLNGAWAFNAKADFTIASDKPIQNFLHLVEKTLKGGVKLRNILELNSVMTIPSDQHEGTHSLVEQVWDHGFSQPFSVSSTDSEVSVSVPMATTQPSSQYKISAKVMDTSNTVQNIQIEQRKKCLLSFLEDLTGWQFCGAAESNELPIVSHLKKMASKLSDVLYTMLPGTLKDTVTSFIKKSIQFTNGAFVMKVKFPTSSNNSLRPQHWLELLNSVWIRVREASISVPNTYTATVYDAGTTITFDGKLYNFPGYDNEHCTYVLANDYSGYKFTLLQSRDYMTAVLNEIAVSLYKDGRVMVNNSGSFSDLPLFSWNERVSVRREGSITQLTTTYGVGVMCNTEAHYCTYTLKGWYHNRTLGLLGTNDNEASNDLKLRNGSVVQQISTFVNGYEITNAPGCKHRPGRRKTRGVCSTTQKTHLCKNLFQKGDSPLAPCFPFINPGQYKIMCMKQGRCTHDSTVASQTACHIATVYSQVCLQRGIEVNPVPQCVQCQIETSGASRSTKSVGQTWAEQLQRKVDVVFVTSLHQDMEEEEGVSFYAYFKHLVISLKRHLRNEAIVDVQIGLLGYGGEDMMEEPHTYTFNGSLFDDTQTMHEVQQKISSMNADGNTSRQHVEALQLGATYPFRTEAVKLVVWLSSSQQLKGDLSSVIEEYIKINLNLNIVEVLTDQSSETEVERQNSIFTNQLPLEIKAIPENYRHSINRVADKIKDNVKTYIQQCQRCQCRVNNIALGQVVCQQAQCL